MRKQPQIMPPDVIEKPAQGIITQVREYELITPLFGGGVTPGKTDTVTPIRGTEIRGHLRFWWRACRGGQFNGDLAKMKAEEDRIWGKAYKKGDEIVAHTDTVQISVDVLKPGGDIEAFQVSKNARGRNEAKPANNIPAYAAFPLQQTKEELEKPNPPYRYVKRGIAFLLTISFPEAHKNEIEAALWAWETFGGIGARTRRGFGALRLTKIDNKTVTTQEVPPSATVKDWIQKKLQEFVIAGVYPAGVPHLSQNIRMKLVSDRDAIFAWNTLIKKLQRFRQFDRQVKNFVWPEPHAIRRLTRTEGGHGNAHRIINKFPRAAFGLPIIFHFVDGTPPDLTLKGIGEGKMGERFASPVILRPILCSDGRAVGLAILLDGPRVETQNLLLIEKGTKSHIVSAVLTPDEAKTIEVLNGQTDVLKAFFDSL